MSLWRATTPVPLTDAWEDGTTCDVVVVGAGLTGLATAHELTRRGLDVLVLEAREVGGVATSRTTGKVSLLQGSRLADIRRAAGPATVSSYLEANRVGQNWWLETIGEGPDLQVRDAYTYAITDEGRERVLAELHAATRARLAVEPARLDQLELDVPAVAAIRLADQLQAHPGRALARLVEQLRSAGTRIVAGVRATGLKVGSPTELTTDHGVVRAGHVVLATGTPILDRRLHFARLEPQRSYAMSFLLPHRPPSGMYLSLDRSTRSVRSVPFGPEETLVVGGAGHVVGRDGPEQDRVDELCDWAEDIFPGAEHIHTWSAQDYRSEDAVPVVGPLAGNDPRVLCATGFGKWGMTNGAAAALALTGWVTGEVPGWARSLAARPPGIGRALGLARTNSMVAAHLARGWATGAVRGLPEEAPAEGQGVVGRQGTKLVARSTVHGETRSVSAVCTHLGGVLRWNDAECSWDCPLHASRFAPDGQVLEGPATKPLPEA